MPIKVKCDCGAEIEAPDGSEGRRIFCLQCRKTVLVGATVSAQSDSSAPQSSKNEPPDHVDRPPQCQLFKNDDGSEYWKLTCYCGKKIRTPAKSQHRYGKCPKCGRRMKLPGALDHHRPFLISAQPGGGPIAAPSKKPEPPKEKTNEDDTAISPLIPGLEAQKKALFDEDITLDADEDIETVTAAAVKGIPANGGSVSHTAAMTAADRLRPQRASDAGKGRISAWPLAGRIPRFLGAFIDLTVALTISGIVMILAGAELLPPIFLTKEILAVMLVLSGIVAEIIVHLIWSGSLGKTLVIIVVRDTNGRPLGAPAILARGLLKWLLFPGWFIGLVDPQQRTLHDLICGTLVLRGRARH